MWGALPNSLPTHGGRKVFFHSPGPSIHGRAKELEQNPPGNCCRVPGGQVRPLVAARGTPTPHLRPEPHPALVPQRRPHSPPTAFRTLPAYLQPDRELAAFLAKQGPQLRREVASLQSSLSVELGDTELTVIHTIFCRNFETQGKGREVPFMLQASVRVSIGRSGK